MRLVVFPKPRTLELDEVIVAGASASDPGAGFIDVSGAAVPYLALAAFLANATVTGSMDSASPPTNRVTHSSGRSRVGYIPRSSSGANITISIGDVGNQMLAGMYFSIS